MARTKEHKVITHEEVQAAMRKFLAQGGLIRKLPDEVAGRHNRVGAHYAMYESVSDNSGEGESASS